MNNNRRKPTAKPGAPAPTSTATSAVSAQVPAPVESAKTGTRSGSTASREAALPATNPLEPVPRSLGVRSPLEQYLREISEVPLLTPVEEVKLARRIQRGDKRAREHMIRANLRLCVKIARDYEHHGVPLLDLVNEGNIGLMKAVDYFDPTKGAKFSTYSSWWIKQAVKRAVANQSRTIRIPIHLRDRIAHFWRTHSRLHDELGREPTDEEIADEMDMPIARIRKMRRAMLSTISLDAQLGDDDSSTVSEVVADERSTTAYQDLEHRTRADLVRELLARLNDRELTILRQRFGLEGGSEKTLEEVGVMFSLTRERIRQLQNIALTKLRKWIEQREAVPEAG
ncbi:MAG: RNA polymerase sigma factor RpoD/SigA [Verrucomicrobiales bacterium]|nr:RNA polymerase sigma factor RpoD/SigA [Verrucomicrobiales bacterium]